MLKKVPYTSDLISIGNANNYEGKHVFSDGRVAYGWHYAPQQAVTSGAVDYSGLWIAEVRGEVMYKLVQGGLRLGQWIRGENIWYDGYCLPARFDTSSVVYTESGRYTYTGTIFHIDSEGNCMTYYAGDGVRMYDNDGSVVATVPLFSLMFFNRFTTNCTKLASNLYSTTDEAGEDLMYNLKLFQVTEKNKAYVFRRVASVTIDNVFEAGENTMYVELTDVASATLYSPTVEFFRNNAWSNTVTLTASDDVKFRATASGDITISYTYDNTTVEDTVPLLIEPSYRASRRGVYALQEQVVDASGVRPALYPASIQLDTNIKLQMFDNSHNVDLRLVFTREQTEYAVSGDPCRLSSGTRPSDVHCCVHGKDIYIADKERLWLYRFDGTAYTSRYKDFFGLRYCWSLAWLKKRFVL